MSTTDDEAETLLKTDQLAKRLGISLITIRKWRVVGGGAGPDYIRCGRAVRYRWSDVLDWMERRRTTSTSEVGR